MKTIGYGVMMFIIWTAFYFLAQKITGDMFLLGAFASASLISLVGLAILAKTK